MKRPKLPFKMMRSQFIGLAILGLLVLIAQVGFHWLKKTETAKSYSYSSG
ncbi:MAG: hypothetical protein Q4A00_07235 [Flavobacteriaceae bacterium]|nr:hypothetical protein [Flavobacteriaceae bacterium]